MAHSDKDFKREAAKVAKALDKANISRAEAGRRLGMTGDYARVRVSKVLRGRETSWPLLERIRTEILAPEAA